MKRKPNHAHLRKIFAAEAFARANARSAAALRAADRRMEAVEAAKRQIAELEHAAPAVKRLALRCALLFINTVSVRRVVVAREDRPALALAILGPLAALELTLPHGGSLSSAEQQQPRTPCGVSPLLGPGVRRAARA